MATVADTLKQIQNLQKQIDSIGPRDWFVIELMNFSSVIFFQYLSHVVLDGSRHHDLSDVQGSEKYYELFSQNGLLEEFVRINNIGQFICIWNSYEKYLRTKYREDYGLEKHKISTLFEDLLKRINLINVDQIQEEFDVMRLTRNSLHDGGIYNPKFPPFNGCLCGQTYQFYPGLPVVPLRVMDVIETAWLHYQAFEKISL